MAMGFPASAREYVRHVRKSVAPTLKAVCLRTGIYSAVRRLRPTGQVGILRYHAVTDPASCWYAEPGICLSPADFESQVAYLTRHYRILPLELIVRALRSGEPLPSDALAITFDDGYADNYEAARILARYGATATFYLTAACIGGEAPFWVSELRALLGSIEHPQIVLHPPQGAPISVALGSATDRKQALKEITRTFKSQPIATRDALLAELRGIAGNPRIPDPMLTWAQVREMHRMGMTIGGHTLTHANLPSAGLDGARVEITACRERLQRELGAPVTMFAYPNGGAVRYFTPDIQRLVREAGFEAATTSTNGFAGRSSDLFALERVRTGWRLEDLAFALEIERFAFKPPPRTTAPQEQST